MCLTLAAIGSLLRANTAGFLCLPGYVRERQNDRVRETV
jgi:hypothetical protein